MLVNCTNLQQNIHPMDVRAAKNTVRDQEQAANK